MQTVFAMFDNYEDARAAVNTLLARYFDEEEINAMAQVQIAKERIEANLETIDVEVTDEVGRKTVRGLDAMLGRQQPVQITDVGNVYAAGSLATLLARTASAPDAADGGLKGALMDFNVGEETAGTYRQGIRDGGFLVWVRTDDDRASKAASILRNQKGQRVITVGG
ncbi:MAG TPA: hypothetical protein VF177_03885 [Anaerolineae bacterium]